MIIGTEYKIRRAALRLVYLVIALAVWMITFGGRLRRRRFVVLCYHGVRHDQRERFEAQMKRLSGRSATVKDLMTPASGRGRPRIIVTFDDAFANLITNALPALEQHAVPAMIFTVTENLGECPRWTMRPGHPERCERVMTVAELMAVASAPGVQIGSHTATHARLDEVPSDQMERELTSSRQCLETLLEYEMIDIALPHGAWNEPVLRMATSAGYQRVYTLEHDLEPGGLGQGTIGRFSVSPDMWQLEFQFTIDGAYGWLGEFRRVVNRARGGHSHDGHRRRCAEASV